MADESLTILKHNSYEKNHRHISMWELLWNGGNVCRNIKTLFNYEPAATDEDAKNAALQYVRKISGFAKPSAANEEVFERAVGEIAQSTTRLLDSLETSSPPRNRAEEEARAHARAIRRFG